jgi:hypothetical protein
MWQKVAERIFRSLNLSYDAYLQMAQGFILGRSVVCEKL